MLATLATLQESLLEKGEGADIKSMLSRVRPLNMEQVLLHANTLRQRLGR